MPCFYPIDAWQDTDKKVHFYPKNTGADTAPRVNQALNYKRDLKLPCGKCVGCRLERSKQWAIRCLHESQQHDENCFLTLTLKDDTEKLSVKTHQRFMKRLRKQTGMKQLRFYMCGEYGEKNDRPHYHYIVFGYDFPDKTEWRKENGNQLWRSNQLEKIWGKGHCEIGAVTLESCAYVARYVMKKMTGTKAEEHYRRTDEAGNDYWLLPEFNQMSRRPGIGKAWWDDFHTDVYPQDVVITRNRKSKPPRYYDKLLEKLKPIEMEAIKREREQKAKEKADDNTPARLLVKETVARAALANKRRMIQ